VTKVPQPVLQVEAGRFREFVTTQTSRITDWSGRLFLERIMQFSRVITPVEDMQNMECE
jgi:hypothetical protein